MKAEKIYTQHEENKEWASNLAFYKDELKIMETRLTEIASKNSSKEILAMVEHFQNQFILQKEHIDKINHEITISKDAIVSEINKNGVSVDHRSIKDHTDARENIASFEKIYTALKTEFNTFLSPRM